jgi:hypothetical protein
VSMCRPSPQSCKGISNSTPVLLPDMLFVTLAVISSRSHLRPGVCMPAQPAVLQGQQQCNACVIACHVICYFGCHFLQVSLAARCLYAGPARNPAGATAVQRLCYCLTCYLLLLLSSPAGLTCGQVSICRPIPQSYKGNSSATLWQYTCTCKQGQRLNADSYLCTSELQQ